MAKVISIDKDVIHNNGDSWQLADYPPYAQTDNAEEWLGVSEISLQRAKELAFELGGDEAYDIEDEINSATDLDELQDALSELKYFQRDNTYNQSWWGGVVDFGVLTEDGEGYGKGLVLLRMHRGGDPRGNYYDMKAFELDSFIEDFPPYFSRLTYTIKTDEGDLILDTEDMEGYSMNVVSDETGTFEEGDYIKIDDIEDAFEMDGNTMYSFGGGVAVGGLLGAYLGYKIGRARPQKKGFSTEKKVGQKIKSAFSKKKYDRGGGVPKYPNDLSKEEAERLFYLAHKNSKVGDKVWAIFKRTPLSLIYSNLTERGIKFAQGGDVPMNVGIGSTIVFMSANGDKREGEIISKLDKNSWEVSHSFGVAMVKNDEILEVVSQKSGRKKLFGIFEGGGKINSIKELYDTGLQYDYPYATDLVAYFIFGDRSDDNKIANAISGRYSRETADESALSDIMLNYEYSWQDNMEEIDVEVVNELGDLMDYYKRGGRTKRYDNGGGVDLFEDYESIPPQVQSILNKYEDSFEDGDYQGLNKAKNELEKIGYTFDFYVDGQAYDLRPIGTMGKAERFDNGGGVDSMSEEDAKRELEQLENKGHIGLRLSNDGRISMVIMKTDNSLVSSFYAPYDSYRDALKSYMRMNNRNNRYDNGGDVRGFSWYQDFKPKGNDNVSDYGFITEVGGDSSPLFLIKNLSLDGAKKMALQIIRDDRKENVDVFDSKGQRVYSIEKASKNQFVDSEGNLFSSSGSMFDNGGDVRNLSSYRWKKGDVVMAKEGIVSGKPIELLKATILEVSPSDEMVKIKIDGKAGTYTISSNELEKYDVKKARTYLSVDDRIRFLMDNFEFDVVDIKENDGFDKGWVKFIDSNGKTRYIDYDKIEMISAPYNKGKYGKNDVILNSKIYNNDERYARGGNVNTGRSWHLDRARHNKSENYEIPMGSRKKRFDDGGGVDDLKVYEGKAYVRFRTADGLDDSMKYDIFIKATSYEKALEIFYSHLERDTTRKEKWLNGSSAEITLTDYDPKELYGVVLADKKYAYGGGVSRNEAISTRLLNMTNEELAREYANTYPNESRREVLQNLNEERNLWRPMYLHDLHISEKVNARKQYGQGGGVMNRQYLSSLSQEKKMVILNNIAKHYGVLVEDIENEVTDDEAEKLYEYIANDNSLRMNVYNDFQRMSDKYAHGGMMEHGLRRGDKIEWNGGDMIKVKDAKRKTQWVNLDKGERYEVNGGKWEKGGNIDDLLKG